MVTTVNMMTYRFIDVDFDASKRALALMSCRCFAVSSVTTTPGAVQAFWLITTYPITQTPDLVCFGFDTFMEHIFESSKVFKKCFPILLNDFIGFVQGMFGEPVPVN
jgi:hypothetical protein